MDISTIIENIKSYIRAANPEANTTEGSPLYDLVVYPFAQALYDNSLAQQDLEKIVRILPLFDDAGNLIDASFEKYIKDRFFINLFSDKETIQYIKLYATKPTNITISGGYFEYLSVEIIVNPTVKSKTEWEYDSRGFFINISISSPISLGEGLEFTNLSKVSYTITEGSLRFAYVNTQVVTNTLAKLNLDTVKNSISNRTLDNTRAIKYAFSTIAIFEAASLNKILIRGHSDIDYIDSYVVTYNKDYDYTVVKAGGHAAVSVDYGTELNQFTAEVGSIKTYGTLTTYTDIDVDEKEVISNVNTKFLTASESKDGVLNISIIQSGSTYNIRAYIKDPTDRHIVWGVNGITEAELNSGYVFNDRNAEWDGFGSLLDYPNGKAAVAFTVYGNAISAFPFTAIATNLFSTIKTIAIPNTSGFKSPKAILLDVANPEKYLDYLTTETITPTSLFKVPIYNKISNYPDEEHIKDIIINDLAPWNSEATTLYPLFVLEGSSSFRVTFYKSPNLITENLVAQTTDLITSFSGDISTNIIQVNNSGISGTCTLVNYAGITPNLLYKLITEYKIQYISNDTIYYTLGTKHTAILDSTAEATVLYYGTDKETLTNVQVYFDNSERKSIAFKLNVETFKPITITIPFTKEYIYPFSPDSIMLSEIQDKYKSAMSFIRNTLDEFNSDIESFDFSALNSQVISSFGIGFNKVSWSLPTQHGYIVKGTIDISIGDTHINWFSDVIEKVIAKDTIFSFTPVSESTVTTKRLYKFVFTEETL